MRYILSLFLILFSSHTLAAPTPERWVVYYTDALPADAFQPFDVIVFDSDSHPPLASLKAQHKILLGYLSLGEAEAYRSYYQDVRSKKLLLEANPAWKGHRIVDVRKPEWTRYALDKLIPPILAQGFDGIMIDTIDSVTQLEDDHPKKYAGMKQAAVQLIQAIRARYPNMKIMLNRGFAILPHIADNIDMVMAESTYAVWAPKKDPALVSAADRTHYVDLLQSAKRQSPTLKVYTIDYWPPEDTAGITRIYAAQRSQGFVPYVATPDLQSLHREPQ